MSERLRDIVLTQLLLAPIGSAFVIAVKGYTHQMAVYAGVLVVSIAVNILIEKALGNGSP